MSKVEVYPHQSVLDYEPVDPDALYIVIDTFRFSTSVTVALENTIESVITYTKTPPENENIDGYGSEVQNKTIKPNIANSPTQIKLYSDKTDGGSIALSSDNGCPLVHRLVEQGATNIALGCIRNSTEIAEYITTKWNLPVYIIPSHTSTSPVHEDTVTALLISNLIHTSLSEIQDVYRHQLEQSYIWQTRTDDELRKNDVEMVFDMDANSVIPFYHHPNKFTSEQY